jgi:hypothetical protein
MENECGDDVRTSLRCDRDDHRCGWNLLVANAVYKLVYAGDGESVSTTMDVRGSTEATIAKRKRAMAAARTQRADALGSLRKSRCAKRAGMR